MSGESMKVIERLKNKRKAKKGSITKRINEIMQLLNDSGSRTKINFLLAALIEVRNATQVINDELAALVPDQDETWMENEIERVDTISADVQEYMESRVNDAPSSVSLSQTWVRQHALGVPSDEEETDSTENNVSSFQSHLPTSSTTTNFNNSTDYPSLQNEGYQFTHTFSGLNYPAYPPMSQFMHTSQRSTPFGDAAAHIQQQSPHPSSSHQNIHNRTNVTFSNDAGGITSHSPQHKIRLTTSQKNEVDSWIDDLDESNPRHAAAPTDVNAERMMGWFAQQSLPRMSIPEFDGAATSYIEFITKIRDLVHNQPFLTDIQRSTLLVQHLTGEAKLAVKAYSQDWKGYVASLKKLKFLFGQRSAIARAVLSKITRGKFILDDDSEGLAKFYYTVSECLTTLKQLNYASDLFSSDTLLQTVKRLPRRLVTKWADYSLTLRQRSEEPNLLHFETWLQARVLAQRDACVVETRSRSKHVHMTLQNEETVFWKSERFKALKPSEKFQKVSQERCCFNCLKKGHMTRTCPSRGRCLAKGCKKLHHTVLHEYFSASKYNGNQSSKGDEQDDKEIDVSDKSTVEFNGMVRGPSEVYLQVVPVVLHANNRKYRTYALLDSGSQFTLIRASVAKRLKLHGEKKNIGYETVKETEQPDVIPAEKVSLSVSSTDSKNSFLIKCAYAVSSAHFNMPAQPSPVKEMSGKLPSYIEDLNLKAVKPIQISILIGADLADASLAKEVRRGEPGQPLAIKTMLGWTLFGESTEISELEDKSNLKINMIHQAASIPKVVNCLSIKQPTYDNNLDEALEKFWAHEHCLISPARETAMSQEDAKALHQLEFGTQKLNDHYEVPMLWRHTLVQLPNNYVQARRRFDHLTKRLRADPELYAKYKDVIEQLITKGYAKKLTDEEATTNSKRTWYLPHHPVFNINKPGKIRVVNDAAAEYQGKSLNNSLVTGPDLLNPLNGVLTRFRIGRVAIAGDVEAMFHQVRVKEENSDSLRSLWTDNIILR